MFTKFMENFTITIHYQPILSFKAEKVVGYEALCRAHNGSGDRISPLRLFAMAREENLSFELDTHIRKKAIENFVPFYRQDSGVLLFLNFESHLIDTVAKAEEFLFENYCEDSGIAPKNIVLEIKEDAIGDNGQLQRFCEHYKSRGFAIALDDFGTGSSTFDRLSVAKPDIVKIDRSIISNVQENFVNSEVLRSLSNMCHTIGALPLAEGVEQESEVFQCLGTDINLFQGFLFAKPSPEIPDVGQIRSHIQQIGIHHLDRIQKSIQKKERILQKAEDYAQLAIRHFQQTGSLDISELKRYLQKESVLEAIYLINACDAMQRGDTLLLKKTKNLFFTPAKDGESHFLKEYYYITKESKRGSYLSPKYISQATGNMCRTFSTKFENEGKHYILCFDFTL